MPTYDYVCEKCEQRFEIFQSMNDAKLVDCPAEGCGGRIRRLIGTGTPPIFKGSGFYQTDYRSDSYKAGEKAEAASEGKSSGSAESSTPAKSDPAPKTTTESSPTPAPTPKADAGGKKDS